MASSSLPNFLSFLIPTKTKPPSPPIKSAPSQLSLPNETKEISSGISPQSIALSRSNSSEVMSVVCPSFAYSNTLYCRPFNVQIVVEEDEDEESIVQRFRREVMRAGIIQEVKRRKHHENNQEKVKRKTQEAAKRNRRRKGPFVPYQPGSELGDPLDEEGNDEQDDDFWGGYGGLLPAVEEGEGLEVDDDE